MNRRVFTQLASASSCGPCWGASARAARFSSSALPALSRVVLQIHLTHGFWHESATAWIWALLSFLSSAGLLLLGASGIYLWFAHHKERVIGGVLLALGLGWGLTTLVLTRMAS